MAYKNQSETIAALQARLEQLENTAGTGQLPRLSILQREVVTKGMHKQLFHRLKQFLGFPDDEKEGAEIEVKWWVGIPGDPNSEMRKQTAVLKKQEDGKLRWEAKSPPEFFDKEILRGRTAGPVVAMAGMMAALLLCLMPSLAFGQIVNGPTVPLADATVTQLVVQAYTVSNAVVAIGAGGVLTTNGFNVVSSLVAPQTAYTIDTILVNTTTNTLFYGPSQLFTNTPTVTYTNQQYGTSTIQTNLPPNGIVAPTSMWINYCPWSLPGNSITNLGPVGCALYGFTTNITGVLSTNACEQIKVAK
jgi:hypothetical protein